MINRVINYKATGAAGVEDGVISVFSTRVIKVGGRECLYMERGPEDGLVFAICALMDYSIVDVEAADVFGDTWSLICTDEGEGVVAGIPRVVAHPLAPWVVSVPLFGLSGGMSHPCWISGVMEKGRWGAVNRSLIFFLHIWIDDVGENGDVVEV